MKKILDKFGIFPITADMPPFTERAKYVFHVSNFVSGKVWEVKRDLH